jgi:hypothetical protein
VGTVLSRLEAVPDRRLLAGLAGCFALAHGAFYLLGVRFDSGPLESFWQYLDVELLRHDLLRSVLYLHAQPPLFNLFLGVVLKLAPGAETAAFQAVFLTLGLVLLLTLYLTQRRLGVGKPLSLGLSALFVLSPSFILYEHWLFYTFPEATLLTASVYLLHRWLDTRRTSRLVAFFGALFLLAGIRSIFHLAWFAAVGLALAVRERHAAKRVLTVAAIPFLLLFALYAKNLWLFGMFSPSSWLGMSVAKVTLLNVPGPRLAELVDAGQLSEIAAIPPFSELESYPSRFRDVDPPAPLPAVAAPRKSNDLTNYNHAAYLGISRQYFADSLATARHEPRALALGLAKALFRYFQSSSVYEFIATNRERLRALDALYDRVLYGRLPWSVTYRDKEYFVYLFLVLGLPAAWIHGVLTIRRRAAHGLALDENARLTLAYICFNVLYVAVLVTTLEVGENHRLRFVTDPLSLMLIGLLAERLVGERLRSRRERR